MFAKHFFAVATVAISLMNHGITARGYSNCGLGSGEDMCNPRVCTPMVVRPMTVSRPPLPVSKIVCNPIGGVAPLVPLPGPCSCTKAIVKPATVPRPACKSCCRKTCCSSSCASNQQDSCNEMVVNNYGGAMMMDRVPTSNYQSVGYPSAYYSTNPAAAAPADAVSLSIAYKMAQKACIHNEDKLAFGFRKMPKELPPVPKRTNNIPEENLYSLNGQIVELKPVQCSGQSLDEEAADELLALSEESIEPANIRKVSLGEIGYGPAKSSCVPFIDVPIANPIEVAAEAAMQQAKCNDGFVPGGVVFKTIPKPRAVVIQPQIPCDEVEEIPDNSSQQQQDCQDSSQQSYGCGCGGVPCGCGGGSYYRSSSSSSSCANRASNKMFMQKLGCM